MQSIQVYQYVVLLMLSTTLIVAENNENWRSKFVDNSEVLSRRKRYLIFPDGSSFQLVFCTENQGYLRVGNVLWFGNTAALAWELPTDPSLFSLFKQLTKDKGALRRTDTSKHIYYLDEAGKVIQKLPYKRKPIVYPVFAKRSINPNSISNRENIKDSLVKDMHEMRKNTSNFEDLETASITFHREARRSLYVKLEKFLEGLGWHGRQCVLQMLCTTGQSTRNVQGAFFEEIMKAVFTLPVGSQFKNTEHAEYDSAHRSVEDCYKKYNCQNNRLPS